MPESSPPAPRPSSAAPETPLPGRSPALAAPRGRALRCKPCTGRAANAGNDASRQGTRCGTGAAGHETGPGTRAARTLAASGRRFDQWSIEVPRSTGAPVVQRELRQRRGSLAPAAGTILRGHPPGAACRLAGRERAGHEVPVMDLDAVLAQDRHRQVELGDVVDVDPQASLLVVGESGEPGAEAAALLQEIAAGPDGPGIELAHESAVHLQDRENPRVEDLVQGRGLVVVEAGRGGRRQAVQDQRSAELVAHDRRDLACLLGVALLALHACRDAHHDDDDEHRDAVGETVDEGDPGEVGHAPGAPGCAGRGGCTGHGCCSAYSRM